MIGRTASGRSRPVIVYAPLLIVLGLVLVHAIAVCQDYASAVASPLEIDYGEGIVWQQAVLIPGPSMYSRSQALPFIVFHYPPLYHLLVRGLAHVMPGFLAAGRALSGAASLLVAGCVAGLVLTARRSVGRIDATDMLAAGIAGLLLLCVHVVHLWGMVMRVDATAIAFAVGGLLIGLRGNARLVPTILGLFLCLCAAFTKQTQLSAGVALFVVTAWRAPRVAMLAGGIVGGVGVAAVGLLQWLTGGGFLLNVVGYNINRFSLGAFYGTVMQERSSVLVVLAIMASAAMVLLSVRREVGWQEPEDRAGRCRVVILLYLGLSTLTLSATFKSGGGFNYLYEWMAVGCTLFGIATSDLARRSRGGGDSAGLLAMLAPVTFTLLFLPMHFLDFLHDARLLAVRRDMVARIAAAEKPVASDNMTLLMQAGKSVTYEPAIVTELASIGRWDETPLVEMIKARKFAFVIATNSPGIEATRRTPAVRAAIALAYPRMEEPSPGLRVRLPE